MTGVTTEVVAATLSDPPGEVYLAIAILAASYVSTFYLWKLYLEDPRRPRGWWLQTVAIAATVKVVVGTYFGFVVAYRWLVDLTLPAELRPLSTIAVAALLLAPVGYAARAWSKRRNARRRIEALMREGVLTEDDLAKEDVLYADTRKTPEP